MNKTTEWKRLSLSKEAPDFAKVKHAHLEIDGDAFVSLTFTLKDGRTVRLRKSNYDVQVESPVMPMETLFQVKVGQLITTFKTQEEADAALGSLDGEVSQIQVPRNQLQLDDLPF